MDSNVPSVYQQTVIQTEDSSLLQETTNRASTIKGWPLVTALKDYQIPPCLSQLHDSVVVAYVPILDSRSRVRTPTLSQSHKHMHDFDTLEEKTQSRVPLRHNDHMTSSQVKTWNAATNLNSTRRKFPRTKIPAPVYVVKAPKRKAKIYKPKTKSQEQKVTPLEVESEKVTNADCSLSEQNNTSKLSSLSHKSIRSNSIDTLHPQSTDWIPSMCFETKSNNSIHYHRAVDHLNERENILLKQHEQKDIVQMGWSPLFPSYTIESDDFSENMSSHSASNTLSMSRVSNKSRARLKFEQMLKDYYDNHYQGPRVYSLKRQKENRSSITSARVRNWISDSKETPIPGNYYCF